MIWTMEKTNVSTWQMAFIGRVPEEGNKGLNQSNGNENEEVMVFRKDEVFKLGSMGSN